jgi:histone H3/H4
LSITRIRKWTLQRRASKSAYREFEEVWEEIKSY